YLSWSVTAAALALVPLFIIPAKLVARRLQHVTREEMQLNGEMSTVTHERFNVAGAMLAKLYGRPREDTAVFASRARRVRDVGVAQAMYGQSLFTALTLAASLATAVLYGLGGALAIKPMSADPPRARPLPRHPGPGPAAPPQIRFDHVSFRYPTASEVSLASLEPIADPNADRTRPGDHALRDITFTIPPGTLTALVGPSGARKTTIPPPLPRLYDVTAGHIRINGHDIRDLTLQSLHDTVGVVTQDA